jgi:hypothetical protein
MAGDGGPTGASGAGVPPPFGWPVPEHHCLPASLLQWCTLGPVRAGGPEGWARHWAKAPVYALLQVMFDGQLPIGTSQRRRCCVARSPQRPIAGRSQLPLPAHARTPPF